MELKTKTEARLFGDSSIGFDFEKKYLDSTDNLYWWFLRDSFKQNLQDKVCKLTTNRSVVYMSISGLAS